MIIININISLQEFVVILIILAMGRISYEDKMRIQTLHEQGLGAKAIGSRYPAKQWSLNTLKTTCRHITKTGSAVTRQSGSGRPKSARTAQNTAAVGDMICSQEDQPGTSKSSRQIAETLGISDRSVRPIAKMDLELSAWTSNGSAKIS